MDYYKTNVKKYKKTNKKRSKTGKIKEIITFQYVIPLKQDNPYKNEDFVYILNKNELKELLNKLNKNNHQLDVLRNRFDHLQARFNKCQEEQNKLERELSYLRLLMLKIKKRNLFERVLNRLPEALKELEEGKIL
jgi:hypothetical protein